MSKVDEQLKKIIAAAITHGWNDANEGKIEPDKKCKQFAEATVGDINFVFASLIKGIIGEKEEHIHGKFTEMGDCWVCDENDFKDEAIQRAKERGIDIEKEGEYEK